MELINFCQVNYPFIADITKYIGNVYLIQMKYYLLRNIDLKCHGRTSYGNVK